VEIKQIQDWVKTVEEQLEAIGLKAAEATEMVFHWSQKEAQRNHAGGGRDFSEGWGAQITRSDELKAFSDTIGRRPSSFAMELKEVSSTSNSAGQVREARQDDWVMLPRRKPMIRQLLSYVPTDTGIVEYPRQTTRTLNAGMVAEGTLKPESDMAFELKQVPMKKIAHWVRASSEILADVPQLESMIDQDLRDGLALKEDEQLLYGDGTGANIAGIVPQATAYAAPFTISGMNMIDQIGLALLQSALTDVDPEGIVLHPSDWLRMCLLKDAAGGYLILNPQSPTARTLFGKPVVATKGITVDKFLTGPFFSGARLFDRQAPTVLLSTEDRDNFVTNKVTILGEERVGLGVKLPASFVYGDFGFVA
jgi:HK97 family phage major capsid protein